MFADTEMCGALGGAAWAAPAPTPAVTHAKVSTVTDAAADLATENQPVDLLLIARPL